MNQTHSVNDVYQAQLVQPVQTNIEQQNAIRQQIIAYRQQHQV
jgi:hypothetical protein